MQSALTEKQQRVLEYPPMRCGFSDVLIQGKVIGIQRRPEGIK